MNAIYFPSSTNTPKNLTSEKSKIFKGGEGRFETPDHYWSLTQLEIWFDLIQENVKPEERTKTTIFPVFWSLQLLSTNKSKLYLQTAVYKLQYMNIRLYVNGLCTDCSI